jgi:hypothetical protein
MTATASDADGTIAAVRFFAGTTLVGTDTSSPYSVTWNNVAAGSYSLTAVAQDNAGATTTSAARTITVAAGGLPSGWASGDIGNPQVPGSAQHSAGIYRVRGGGADIWGTSDQFYYAYRQVTGDVDIVSRVASVEAADTWTKAGVMIRETLAANAAHAFVVVTPGGEISFQRRPSTGADSQFTLAASGTAPYWVRLERRGGTVTAFTSADGATWSTAGQMTLATSTVYIGLAVTAHNASAAATAEFDNVVAGPSGGTNQPPAVSLTAPANGATFTAPATVTVSATASDSDGTIAAVDFFAGTTLIGSDTSSPYSVTWNNVPAGTYSLTAVARDNAGATTTSAARSISVTSSLPRPARAVFVASSNHNTAVDRYVLNIYASGANPDTATPLATQDLGKPPVSNGECDVDISSTVQSLSPGSYIATVTAVGPGGSTRSAPSAPFTR